MKDAEPIEISVVVPVDNEEENLPVLIAKIVEGFKEIGVSYEMIFVDDGSSDGSLKVLKETASRTPFLRIIKLKQNRGLSTALLVGVREARGEKIVTLDAYQNDPGDIPRLLGYLDQYDMATGWRQKREDPWLKKISSKIANAIRNRLSGEEIRDSSRAFFTRASFSPLFRV